MISIIRQSFIEASLNLFYLFNKFFLNILFVSLLLIISACGAKVEPANKAFPKSQERSVVDIAIMLPLATEEDGQIHQYNQMIKMGLSDNAKSRIRVTSYDCSNEENAKESLSKILQQGTEIIIGPLYSPATKDIVSKIKGKNIIIISLSNDPVLAEKGVFVFGHAPMRQFEQVANYFLNNNYKNYIALLPKGYHSQTTAKILQNMITTQDATLARVEFYNNTPEDINRAVNIVSDTVDNLNEMDTNLTKPVIMIGDDPRILQNVFADLTKYNLDKKAIIAGDNRIDIDYAQLPVNLIYTGSKHLLATNIKEKARKIGINHFSFMHSLAYDAGKIVATAIGTNYSKNNFLAKLDSTIPYDGISGQIHFIDSIAQRKYDIIQKSDMQYNVLP